MMEIGMFDEVKTVRVEETANGKRFVTDEESLEEIELTEASIALSDAEATAPTRETSSGGSPKLTARLPVFCCPRNTEDWRS
jgi:hypothetical protein